jgi:wobble nucleotide-excising tRNase
MQVANFQVQIANYNLQTAKSKVQVANFMVQNSSGEASSYSYTQEIPPLMKSCNSPV